MQQQATSSSNNSSSTAAVAAAAGKQHEAATDSWEVTAVHVCGGPPEDEGHPRSPCEGGPRPKGPPQASCSPGPLRGCDLAFKRVACSVKTKRAGKHKEQLTILHPISGVIPAGSVVALMGPSGSGKTTLLDCLSGRKQQHEGEVFLNGQPRTERRLKQVSIYVPQEPYYSGHEIVREVLDFSAALKTKHSAAERRALVDGTLEFLGLTKVADKRVGSSRVKGISGGQRQRVMAGQALVSMSKLCFCDEPTSGLSSTDAASLVRGMREIALKCGVTFLVVIHQPRVEVFNCFDFVILLAQGKCIYQGPRSKMEAYFSQLGHPLQMYENPAECYLELVTPGCPHYCLDALAEAYERLQGPEDELRVERHLLGFKQQEKGSSPHVEQTGVAAAAEAEGGEADGEKETSGHREREAETTGLSDLSTLLDDTGARGVIQPSYWSVLTASEDSQREGRGSSHIGRQDILSLLLKAARFSYWTVASWLTQYSVLQRRAFRRTLRDKRALALSVVAIYCFAVLTGFLFFKVYPRKPVFYQLSAPALLTSTLSVIPFVNTIGYLERKLQFMHETADGYYFPGPHLLAETVTSCTMTALMVLPSLLLVFLFCGFPLSRLPMAFLLFFCFEALVDSLMQLCAAAFNSFMTINAVGGGWLFLTSTLNGLNVNPRSMPAGLRFLSFMSPYFYLFDGFAISLYEGNSEIFDDPSCVKTFGYSSAAEVFSAFGLAGSLSNTTLSPSQWLWAVDVSVLLVSTLGAHLLYLFVWQRKKLSK